VNEDNNCGANTQNVLNNIELWYAIIGLSYWLAISPAPWGWCDGTLPGSELPQDRQTAQSAQFSNPRSHGR